MPQTLCLKYKLCLIQPLRFPSSSKVHTNQNGKPRHTDQIFIFYKVERKNLKEGIYSLFLEVNGEGFTSTQEGAMSTGDLQNGVYYGYSSMKVIFDDINEEDEEITLKLTPIYFGYITREEEGEESIINSKEINLTIRDKAFR